MKRTVFEPEHESYRQVVREFVNRHLAAQIDRHRREHSIDRQTWRTAGEFGLLGFFVPDEYGGGGVSFKRMDGTGRDGKPLRVLFFRPDQGPPPKRAPGLWDQERSP